MKYIQGIIYQYYIIGISFATFIVFLLALLMFKSYLKNRFRTIFFMFLGLVLTIIGLVGMVFQFLSSNILDLLFFLRLSTLMFTLEFLPFSIASEYMRTTRPSLWFLCAITFLLGVMIADILLFTPVIKNIDGFWIIIRPRSIIGTIAFYSTAILIFSQFLHVTYLLNKFASPERKKVVHQMYWLYVILFILGILGFYVSYTTGLHITPIIYAVILSGIAFLIIKNPYLISLLPTKIYELLVFREDGILIYSKEFLPGVSESFHLLVADFLSALASFFCRRNIPISFQT